MDKVTENVLPQLETAVAKEVIADGKKPKIRLAAWWRRFLSFLIDLFFISLIFNITIQLFTGHDVLSLLNQNSGYYNYRYFDDEEFKIFRIFARFGILITMLIYYLILEIATGRTIGKFITGTIVLDIDSNKRTSADRIIGRTLSRYIPFEIFSFLSLFPRGWHDTFSGTYVATVKEKRYFETGIDKTSFTSKFVKYFFSDVLNKGYQRLLIAGSFILPFLLGFTLYRMSGRLIEGYEDNYGYYDENQFYSGVVFGMVIYWIIYFLSVWIYKGFKDSK